jgi:hypothetical protein
MHSTDKHAKYPQMTELSRQQLAIVVNPPDAHTFLEGPAGCGKTTVGVERLLHLMAEGIPGSSILLMVPQRTLAQPYYQALNTPGVVAGGLVEVVTLGGLARRMVDLFWVLLAEKAGFAHPERTPTFLTLETAQYYMAHLVRPLLAQGYFDSVVLDRNRLFSQVIDNLNKAALVGFPHTEIGERLKAAWAGDPGQVRIYEDAQSCANLFRDYCYAHNLLDFSLQVEVFMHHLWDEPLCRRYLLETYRHIIVDNSEEDSPAAHNLLRQWLPECQSALLIYDQDAGYRRFLGADPQSAYELKNQCNQQVILNHSFVTSPATESLGMELVSALNFQPKEQHSGATGSSPLDAVQYSDQRFFPQMVDWVVEQIRVLVNEQGVPPSEIVVLAPYLSDALRFALTHRLGLLGVPARAHRPSRSLRDEPATRCLLTLAALAHPSWEMPPTKFDMMYALVQAIDGLDLVRAQLMVEIVFRNRQGEILLSPFEEIRPEMQERITYLLGERYERLRLWLDQYRQGEPEELDHFISRLFGEVLSQPGFGFHGDFNAGEVAANLVESIQKFRWAVAEILQEEGIPLGKEYLIMVQDGVIAAQYIRSWQLQADEFTGYASGVLLAPAYTFLMSNRPVTIQFWLDAGSQGWFERLYQPITHPYVLSLAWLPGKTWTADDEFAASREALSRLVLGLTRRCRERIYLGLSELNEQGYEHRGPLLLALQRVLRQSAS